MNKIEILRCENINFKYSEKSKREIIKNLSLSFHRGDIYLVTGFSGCGKSTLAYILAGLYPEHKGVLTEGRVFLDNKDIGEYSIQERAKKIGMMFQNTDTQFCMESVKEEIIFTLENIKLPVEKMDEKVDEILKKVEILELRDRELSTLSGGEKQKVALASILALEPEVIILDEPFANVDIDSAHEIIDILLELNSKRKTTLIIIDHRLSLWKNINYNLITLENGTKVLNRNINRELEDSKPLKKKVYIEGENISNSIIEVKKLELRYDNNILASNLSFQIPRGKITSIIGKSGSGKSTIFNLITNLYNPDKGEILFDGIPLTSLDKDSIRGNLSLISQNPYIFNMSIRENLTIIKDDLTEEEMIDACKMACLHDFIISLKDGYDTIVGEGGVVLSGGQKQRLAIARALVLKTEIILFDEATSALDNETQYEIQQSIANMQGEYTILIIAHRLSTVINSDRILLIDDGKIVGEGTHHELLENNLIYQKLYKLELSDK